MDCIKKFETTDLIRLHYSGIWRSSSFIQFGLLSENTSFLDRRPTESEVCVLKGEGKGFCILNKYLP